jgi:hypothetical protein
MCAHAHTYIYMNRFIIIEANKSHDLSSVRWRPRKGSDIIQSKSKGLGGQWHESQSETYVPALASRHAGRKTCKFLPPQPFLFYSGSQWIGWCSPTWRGGVLYCVCMSEYCCSQEMTHTHTQKCLNWAPCGPVKLSCKINCNGNYQFIGNVELYYFPSA